MSYLQIPQVLLVTYDLKTPLRDYAPFYEALKQQGAWLHYLDSTWLISTSHTPQQLYNAVVSHITTSDRLLIVPITRPYYGFMPKDVWDWLDKHLPHSLSSIPPIG